LPVSGVKVYPGFVNDSLKNVSKRLGHSAIGTTGNIYAHALESVDKAAANKMDKLLTERKNSKKKARQSIIK